MASKIGPTGPNRDLIAKWVWNTRRAFRLRRFSIPTDKALKSRIRIETDHLVAFQYRGGSTFLYSKAGLINMLDSRRNIRKAVAKAYWENKSECRLQKFGLGWRSVDSIARVVPGVKKEFFLYITKTGRYHLHHTCGFHVSYKAKDDRTAKIQAVKRFVNFRAGLTDSQGVSVKKPGSKP